MTNIHCLTAALLVPTILASAVTAQAADAQEAVPQATAPAPAALPATQTPAPAATVSAPTNAPPAATAGAATAAVPAPDYNPPRTNADVQHADPGPSTLFGSHPKLGGYGGISALLSRFDGLGTGEFCLEGAVLLDRKLSLGLAGCGLSRSIKSTKLDPNANPDYRTRVGFGGALVRYHFASYQYFNFAVGTLIGGGAISSNDWRHDEFDDEGDTHPDAIFVLEPHVAAYVTLTRWLRVGATGGYRIVGGVDKRGLSNSDLSAPVAGLQVQAGWF